MIANGGPAGARLKDRSHCTGHGPVSHKRQSTPADMATIAKDGDLDEAQPLPLT